MQKQTKLKSLLHNNKMRFNPFKYLLKFPIKSDLSEKCLHSRSSVSWKIIIKKRGVAH